MDISSEASDYASYSVQTKRSYKVLREWCRVSNARPARPYSFRGGVTREAPGEQGQRHFEHNDERREVPDEVTEDSQNCFSGSKCGTVPKRTGEWGMGWKYEGENGCEVNKVQ